MRLLDHIALDKLDKWSNMDVLKIVSKYADLTAIFQRPHRSSFDVIHGDEADGVCHKVRQAPAFKIALCRKHEAV